MADKDLHNQGEDFTPLRQLLPLAAPLAMSLDTAETCNFRCRFCVYNQSRQANLIKRPPGGKPFMEMAVFAKLVRDLEEFPQRVKKLSMHCRGEPLLNPNIAKMIAMMYEADVAESIKLSTNGSLMTRDMAREMLKAGLGQLVFSIEHVTDEGYGDITGGAWSDYGRILENFRIFREERDKGGYKTEICAKILDFITDQEKDAFRADFGPFADKLLITGLYGSSYHGVVDGTMGQGQKSGFYKSGLKMDRVVCPEPFFFLTVDVRGEVMPCWMDWSNGAVIGNIMETSLHSIWNGPALQTFRLSHLEGRRKGIDICRDCQFIYGIHPQSDIDDDAERFQAVFRTA